MQNRSKSILVNHDGEDGFVGYSIDYGPSIVDRSQRELFVSHSEASKFCEEQLDMGNSVGMFYIYEEA